MTAETAVAETTSRVTALMPMGRPPQTLVERFAGRYHVDAAKLLTTLKHTAFKQRDGEVSNEQMMALLVVADQYKLNPFTKEIFAFPDRSGIVPVVGLDGWARIINEHQQFDGMDLTMAEDGSSCTCSIHRKDRGHPISVTEYLVEVRRDTAPWKSHPRRMLRHKAIIQCARIAFGFAGIYDEDEAERIVEAEVVGSDRITPTTGAWDSLNEQERQLVHKTAEAMKKRLIAYDVPGAVEKMDASGLDSEGQVALWTLFDSKARTAMRRENDARSAAAKLEHKPDLDKEAAAAMERDGT